MLLGSHNEHRGVALSALWKTSVRDSWLWVKGQGFLAAVQWGAVCLCSIPDRVTPRTETLDGLCFSTLALDIKSSTTDWPARNQYNSLSDSFLLTTGGIELTAWHSKIVGRRSPGVDRSDQTRQVQLISPRLHPHTPACTTEFNLQSVTLRG